MLTRRFQEPCEKRFREQPESIPRRQILDFLLSSLLKSPFFDLHCLLTFLFIAEQKLAMDGQLEGYSTERPYFPGKPGMPLYIEDDHLPFLKKGK